jgi:hypothetical protein
MGSGRRHQRWLNESAKWSADAIERQLAHQDQDQIRAAYVHVAEFWPERVRMMKWWASYLDELRERGRVIGISTLIASDEIAPVGGQQRE